MGPDEARQAELSHKEPDQPFEHLRDSHGLIYSRERATGMFRRTTPKPLSKRERAKIKRQAKKQPLAPAAVRARVGAFFA